MRAELRFTADQYQALHEHLLPDDAEHAALLICGLGSGGKLLLCRQVLPLTINDLEPTSGRLHLDVSPLALARVTKKAAGEGCTVVVCHSHPFPGRVVASCIDLETERELCGRVLPGRLAGRPAGALILGPDGFDGRLWQKGEPKPLGISVAGSRQREAAPNVDTSLDERTARQLLVWGAQSQQHLSEARVAVVGVGGTGSHVTTQLAHLGVGQLVLVDPDIVEVSNLSRLIGATVDDVGRAKVDAMAAAVARVRPDTAVERVAQSVLDIDASRLAGCDVVVGCTDTHGSRALLTELAAQYHLPLIDLGIEILPGPGGSRAGGGVRVIRPGDPCLHCMGVLDSALVRQDFLTNAQLNDEVRHGYLRGVSEPAPSVVSLNGVVASLAVVEVLDVLLGLFVASPRRLLYRAEARTVTTAAVTSEVGCFVCGQHGIAGLGDARELPRREAEPRAGSA